MPNSTIDSPSSIGKLGPELLINLDELYNVMKTYGYQNEEFVNFTIAMSAKFNMLISQLYAQSQLQEGLETFILSIGKTRARENSRNKIFAQKDRVINTSLFNLVDGNDVGDLVANENSVKGVQNKLVRVVIDISNDLIKQMREINKLG